MLDSFPTRGADGATYKVMAYEHLQRVELTSGGQEQWEPTGLTEYRLASGERVDPLAAGEPVLGETGRLPLLLAARGELDPLQVLVGHHLVGGAIGAPGRKGIEQSQLLGLEDQNAILRKGAAA